MSSTAESVPPPSSGSPVSEAWASTARQRLRRILGGGRLALSLGLAFIPSVLVVVRFWRSGDEPLLPGLDALWSRIPFLNGLPLPSFFILVLAAYAALGLLFAVTRRDPAPWTSVAFPSTPRAAHGNRRLAAALLVSAGVVLAAVLVRIVHTRASPGIEFFAPLLVFAAARLFAEVSPGALRRLASRAFTRLPAVLLLQLATLIASFALLGRRSGSWISLVGVVLAAAAAWRVRRRLPAWVWIVPLAIGVRMLFLNEWWYTLIGDEGSFWGVARDMLIRAPASEINERLLTMSGVYQQFPYLASVVQAAGMAVAGLDNFGWKVSSIWISALAIPFYFGFFRVFAGRRVATYGAFLLAASHYLMSFSKIGYSNLQAHMTMALVLSAAGFAARTKRPFAYTLTGLAAGACFYVYPAALYCLPLPALLLVIYDPPRSREAIGRWASAAAAALLVVFPILFDSEFFLSKLAGLFLGNRDLEVTGVSPALHFAREVFYTLMSHLLKLGESHFVGISYQDPISAGLIGIGTVAVLRRLPRDRFAAFLAVGWAALVMACSTHGTEFPPTTRMFMVLPFFSLFAAIGLAWTVDRLREAGVSARIAASIGALVLAAALAANLWQAYVLSPPRMLMYQKIEAAFVRAASNARDLESVEGRHFLFITREWTVAYGFYDLRQVYGLPPVFDVKLEGDRLPAGAMRQIRDRAAIVVIRPEIEGEARTAIEREVSDAGKVPCEVENLGHQVQLVVWQSHELPPLCH